jgi:hypothetical protein
MSKRISGKRFKLLFFLGLVSLGSICGAEDLDIHQLWIDCQLKDVISYDVFNIAVSGYKRINPTGKRNIISIADFSKPSGKKRFFVIDIEKKRLIYKCLVAHGKNSGDYYAKSFSNRYGSLKSSLGFYLTADAYHGKEGYSLRLDGLEKGINDNARARAIVVHGADYVSEKVVKEYGRLGRSWGCLALPADISKEIIDTISGGSCLFIYCDDKYYKEHSAFIGRK